MRAAEVFLLAVGILASPTAASRAAQAPQTFTGVISDEACAHNGHASMRMGPTDAECTRLCVTAHGDAYVLYDGKNIYALSDQATPERFAAQKVTVVGVLDAGTRTIQVDSIAAAE
jgi:hypothetical protein